MNDQDQLGTCPVCSEPTPVRESCCGEGAIVEGAKVAEEESDE